MLGKVSVLILVDQHVAEKFLIMVEQVGIVAQQDVGIVEQIVKIHGSCSEATVAVGAVDGIYQRPAALSVGFHGIFQRGIFLRGYQRVFCR